MSDSSRPRTLRRIALLGPIVTLALAAGLTAPAAATEGRGVTAPPVTDLGPTTFAQPGPYAAGQKTLKLATNGAAVDVWYPATKKSVAGAPGASYDLVDWLPPYLQALIPPGVGVTYKSGGVRGVKVAPGRFPLVVFSHGFAGFRDQSTFLTSWLATWGFVVAAPDHRSRDLTKVLGGPSGITTDLNDLRATLALMRDRDDAPSSRFHRHVDTTLVGAVGHSAGGAAVEAWAATDKRVTTFVAMAGATVGAFGEEDEGPRSKIPRQPGLVMAGSSDGIVAPEAMRAAYDALTASKRFLLVGGGHHAFSDLCEVGAAEGGLLQIADLLGVPISESLQRLASDGCEPPALPPTEAWPAIRQATVAHLRHELGIDRSDAGLTGLVEAYPGVVEDSLIAP